MRVEPGLHVDDICCIFFCHTGESSASSLSRFLSPNSLRFPLGKGARLVFVFSRKVFPMIVFLEILLILA